VSGRAARSAANAFVAERGSNPVVIKHNIVAGVDTNDIKSATTVTPTGIDLRAVRAKGYTPNEPTKAAM